jgi:hypothetical protein
MSFRGRVLPEEPAFFLAIVKKQIPRCARGGGKAGFCRSLTQSHRHPYFCHLPESSCGSQLGKLLSVFVQRDQQEKERKFMPPIGACNI